MLHLDYPKISHCQSPLPPQNQVAVSLEGWRLWFLLSRHKKVHSSSQCIFREGFIPWKVKMTVRTEIIGVVMWCIEVTDSLKSQDDDSSSMWWGWVLSELLHYISSSCYDSPEGLYDRQASHMSVLLGITWMSADPEMIAAGREGGDMPGPRRSHTPVLLRCYYCHILNAHRCHRLHHIL